MKSYQILTCLFIILVFLANPVMAKQPKVALILWHDLSWDDLQLIPILERDDLAVGTMNTRIAGGTGIAGAYLTIASGARAFGTPNSEKLLHLTEPYHGIMVSDIYQFHSGKTVDQSEIIHPEIAQIIAASEQASYPLTVGFLAEKIKNADLKIGAFGNSDLRDQQGRWAAVVAMDHSGLVNHGYVGTDLLIDDSNYPHGMRTDYPQLMTRVIESDLDLIVIDLGDPYRYSTYKQYLVAGRREAIRTRMVTEAWDFIANLKDALPETQLIVAAPYPNESDVRLGRWFAPVIVIGGANSGLLTSATTRWPGIIANIDLAPTLLNSLGISKGTMLGRSIEIIPSPNEVAINTVKNLEQRVFWLGNYRSQVLKTLVGFQISLYLLTIALLIIPKRFNDRFIHAVQLALIISLALPLLLLVLPQSWLLVLVLFSLIGFSYCRWKNHQLTIIMVVALLTAGLITLDVLRDSVWMRFSFLGYDPLGGARYYGIGNEYMGVLLGSLILGWSILRGLLKTKQLWFIDLMLFVLVSVIIAAPQLGTNVGGTIAAIAGFGATLIGLNKLKLRPRTIFALGLIIVLSITTLTYLDLIRPEAEQSHIGQTGQLISEEGVVAMFQVIVRKLNMNLRLFRYSIWSRGLIVALIAMGASLIWPSKYLRWLLTEHSYLVKGIVGVLVAAIVALAVNDSGVVAAATCSFFAATTMLCLALNLKHDLLTSQADIE